MTDRREKINVARARKLYDELGNWPAVARAMKRKTGQPFKSTAIAAAVRWADRGNAGRRSGKVTTMRQILDRLPAGARE